MSQNAVIEVGQNIERMADKFAASLPAHIPARKFVRTTLNAIQRNPDIVRSCDRQSIYAACMAAAQDGLILDGREAALVPFKGKATYMPMVAGLLKRARNSGQIARIAAHVVYERDAFEYVLGDEERIYHKPKMADRGKPIGAYAIAVLTDGSVQREFMPVQEIDRIRSMSRSGNAGPWKDHWDEMARKTVLRRLTKYLPYSTELDSVSYEDDDLDPPATIENEEPEEKPRTPSRARARVKAAAPAAHDSETGEIIDVPFEDAGATEGADEVGETDEQVDSPV